jgi:hypothetical protein
MLSSGSSSNSPIEVSQVVIFLRDPFTSSKNWQETRTNNKKEKKRTKKETRTIIERARDIQMQVWSRDKPAQCSPRLLPYTTIPLRPLCTTPTLAASRTPPRRRCRHRNQARSLSPPFLLSLFSVFVSLSLSLSLSCFFYFSLPICVSDFCCLESSISLYLLSS